MIDEAVERLAGHRRLVLGLVAYLLLVGSVLTPLYDPLTTGIDDTWAIGLVLVCAHLGIGVLLPHPWTLALPVGFCTLAFLVAGAGGEAWLILFFGMPLAFFVTVLGCGLGWVLRRRAWPLGAAVFAVAVWPVAWATAETVQRAEASHVPAAVQRALPATGGTLNEICLPEAPAAERRLARRRFEALLVALRRRPDQLVTYTYQSEDAPDAHKDITVRELGEQELYSLAHGGNGPCLAGLRRRLHAALGE